MLKIKHCWLPPAVLLLCAGCATRHASLQTYRLIARDSGEVMLPPGVARLAAAAVTLKMDLTPVRKACPPDAGPVSLRARRDSVVVTVTRDTLAQQPPGWLTVWAARLEATGCLKPGDGPVLADRIAESLALPPNGAFHLLHPDDRQSGEVDLVAGMKIEVVSPILREGAPPDAPLIEQTVDASAGGNGGLALTVKASDDLIGYETALYEVSQTGRTIVAVSAERHIQDEIERRAQPVGNYFLFPPEASFYRLFYKAGRNEFRALVVAARTREELERSARTLAAGPASCEKLPASFCVAIPKQVAVNPLVTVTINGSETPVPFGASVGQIIRTAGERDPRAVLPRLVILKPFHGRPALVSFTPDSGILSLILTGGESVRWK